MPASNKNINYRLQIATVFLGFVIFGLAENIKGPATPEIQASFRLGEQQLGTVFSLNALGYMFACSFTAFLSRRFGLKAVTALAFAVIAFSGIFIYFANSYPIFAGTYFIMYVGAGMLEIALALIGARVFTRNTGLMMNLSHFCYGASSIAAPMIAATLIQTTVFGAHLGWRGMYLSILLLAVVPLVPNFLCHYDTVNDEGGPRKSVNDLLKDTTIWLLVTIISLAVIAELAVGGWLINYLEKVYVWSGVKAAQMLSLFFLFFTLTRLLAGRLIDRIGYAISFAIFSGLSAICTSIALGATAHYAIFFALAGIGIAPIYPTVMAYIAKKYKADSDLAITVTVTIMGFANVIGSYLIGGVSDWVKNANLTAHTAKMSLIEGLRAGYSIIAICMAVSCAVGIALYYYSKAKQEVY